MFWWSFVDGADLAEQNPAAVANNVQHWLSVLAVHEFLLESAEDFCSLLVCGLSSRIVTHMGLWGWVTNADAAPFAQRTGALLAW